MNRRQVLQGLSSLTLSGLINACSKKVNVGPISIPSIREMHLLSSFQNNPDKIRSWIVDNVESIFYDRQFDADFWSSALYFLRIKKEDCDGVLALSHYCLRLGKGIYLNGRGDNESHVVYSPKEGNGLYSIISINKQEHKGPIFESLEEVALSFSSKKYDHYKLITLPEDDEILLRSSTGIKDYVTWGEKKLFSK